MYPRWLQKACQAFEAYYDDRLGQQGVALLEEALLEAVAAGASALPKSPFPETAIPAEIQTTKELQALNQALESFRMERQSKRKDQKPRYTSEELKRIEP